MLASLFGHSMIDIGTQAIAGIGRSTSTDRHEQVAHALILADREAQRHADGDRDDEADQDAPHADGDIDEVLVRQPDLRQLLIHLVGRRNVLEANVELEPVLGSEIPEQEQGPDRDAGKCGSDDPLARDRAPAGSATLWSAKPSEPAPAPAAGNSDRRPALARRPQFPQREFPLRNIFTAAAAGSGSECLSTIGSATIFALARLPIDSPYCPTLMAPSTSA